MMTEQDMPKRADCIRTGGRKAGLRQSFLGIAGAIAGLMASAVAMAGAPSAAVHAVQAAADLRPLDGQAIRFTAIQPTGRDATVYEARRDANGATRTIIDLSSDDGNAWSVGSRETKPVAAETLDYFAGRIDAAIASAPASAPCPDGPDYYAEHGGAGLAGCDTSHPNAAIARALGLAEPLRP